MSTQHPSQEQGSSTEADQQRRAGQSAQWRDIGISAVAAAARQASAVDTRAAAAAPAQNKVVTLRDIDHLAA